MGVTSPREFALLEALADGRFHSGEELGAATGVSRAAVWKQLSALGDYGLEIERVRGKGYRLVNGVSLLNAEKLREVSGLSPADLDLDIRQVTASTNDDALEVARSSLARTFAVLAEVQTRGRGRQGRAWHGALGANLALSVAAEFPGGAQRLEGLSLATGIAVARALRQELDIPVGLKWPNDLYVRERKLGGILIELAGDFDSVCRPVIGLGLNCAVTEKTGSQIGQPWTSLLLESGKAPDRNRLAGVLLRELVRMLETFRKDGFAAFHHDWCEFDVLHGRDISVTQGRTVTAGRAAGVSPRGALLLESRGQILEFAGGEATVRPAATA